MLTIEKTEMLTMVYVWMYFDIKTHIVIPTTIIENGIELKDLLTRLMYSEPVLYFQLLRIHICLEWQSC